MSKSIRISFVLQTGGVIALLLVYLLLWLRITKNPIEYTGSDFITYYSVGVITNRYGLQDAYDLDLQMQIKQDVVGFKLVDKNFMPHNHIPWLNPFLGLLILLTGENYLLAMTVWAFFLLVLYIFAVVQLLQLQDKTVLTWPLLISFLLFFPIFVSLVNGQDTVFVFLGLVLFARGMLLKKHWLAAFGLGLVTLRPQMVIMLGLPVLLARPAVGWRFVVVAIGFVLASILPLGVAGVLDFLNLFTDVVVGSKDHAMFNLVGLLTRSFPALGARIIQQIGWLAYGAGCFGLCLVWVRRMRESVPVSLFGISVIVLLFLSPHLVYHDLALLLLPLAFVFAQAFERGVLTSFDAPPLVIMLSLILLLSSLHQGVQFLVAYLLMSVLFTFLLWPALGDRFFLRLKGFIFL